MRLSAATVGLLLGLALLLGSCGEGDAPSVDQSIGSPGGETSSRSGSAGRSATATNGCRRRLAAFVASMANLRDELARGLSYNQYMGELIATRTVYARIRAGEVPLGCLFAAGGPAERAFNLYIEAANVWGDCLETAGCQTGSIERELQQLWRRAATRLSLAEVGLRG